MRNEFFGSRSLENKVIATKNSPKVSKVGGFPDEMTRGAGLAGVLPRAVQEPGPGQIGRGSAILGDFGTVFCRDNFIFRTSRTEKWIPLRKLHRTQCYGPFMSSITPDSSGGAPEVVDRPFFIDFDLIKKNKTICSIYWICGSTIWRASHMAF